MFTKSRCLVSAHCSFWTAKLKLGGGDRISLMLLFENYFQKKSCSIEILMIYYFCKLMYKIRTTK